MAAELEQILGDDERRPYTVATALAHALVEALVRGDGTAAPVLDALEEALGTAHGESRSVLIVGLVEDIQNVSLNRDIPLERWRPLLGERTAKAWDVVAQLWAGEMTPSDFNSYVATSPTTEDSFRIP